MDIDLILLAGGIGNRMQQVIPKQHLLLSGKPIIMHSLERAEKIPMINKIIITCPENFIESTKAMHASYNLKKTTIFISGGATRQESVCFALKYVKTKNVIIHEAARPFVKKEEFVKLIESPQENIIMATDIPFTVLEGKTYIEKLLDRSNLLNVQLPQKFDTKKILQAHTQAALDHAYFTEDSSLFITYINEKVYVLSGTEYNLKITKPIDLKIGEVIYRNYISGEE
ncbi:MAG: 2-C-methyl-D-erythritol 4-phosphate cytidylyltransferase [Spirochaetia bacterium]|nr:2-C-methyl-D-erythritol 4-phosphate cytidylyltransferase [Spirochaetia bacterium]